jgi:nicotinate-nucleotide adenylyltransferase
MAIGLFGGTFDPIHIGHLRVAEEIREDFSLDRIYFIPDGVPPHKRGRTITGTDERLRMVKAAIRGNRFFGVSEIEARRPGPSYTIDTLNQFGKRFEELYFLIGIDAFSEIETWHLYKELFYHTHFIVMTRPTQNRRAPLGMFPRVVEKDVEKVSNTVFRHTSGKRIYLHDITQMDISSTKVKELLKKHRSIRYLVPASVGKIITERGLYKT